MGMWRSLHPFKQPHHETVRKRGAARRRARQARRQREVHTIERFEDRCLLTSGPVLLTITSNDGGVILPNTPPPVFHTAPSEFTFLFNEGEAISPSSLGGIQLVRAGADHAIGTADDVTIGPGILGIGESPNQVV